MRNTDAQTQQIIKPNTLFCAHDRPTTLLNRTQSVPVNQSRSAKGSVRVCNCFATSLALLYVTASVGACILVSGGQLPLGYGTLCVKIKPASFTNLHAPVITARSPRPSLFSITKCTRCYRHKLIVPAQLGGSIVLTRVCLFVCLFL